MQIGELTTNPQEIIVLSGYDLLISGVLVLLTGILSLLLQLKVEKKIAIAAIRTVVQLLAVGYILRWVFNIDSPYPLFAVLFIMLIVAAGTAVGRSDRKLPGTTLDTFAALVISGFITTFTVTGLIIQVKPWYLPQYVIPLAGMAIGNAMTAVSLSLNHFLELVSSRRTEIELKLSLGATRWEAAKAPLSKSIYTGMIPMINSMMVVGIVSLPGMMTGQILAGADPFQAVKYQVVVMFMVSAATATASILSGLLTYRRLFNDRHQLLHERIRNR